MILFSKEQICTLYSLTNDLQSPAQSKEVREEVVDFYVTIVKTQFEQLGLARVHLFGVVEWKARDKDKVVFPNDFLLFENSHLFVKM